MPSSLRTFATLSLILAALAASPPRAGAYSVLSHEEVVDMAWKTDLVPMLKARFPGITDDDIRLAHAYAYGGSVIQDIGYYPFGSHYFSDLLHYVRPNDFVTALLRDSTTPNEYAFALGALAHYTGDIIGHPYINKLTALENDKLRNRYGSVVTYEEDPLAHVRTEFGFDVVMVAHGAYSQQDYRDFIGFQVAKPLLERAFYETYGIQMNEVIPHEDLAISTYRKSVSSLIPNMTKVAFLNYRSQIEKATPGTEKDKFIYRLNQTEYRRDFGKEYTHVGVKGHLLAFFLRVLPKVGPLKALKVSIPNPQQQEDYLKSINSTVDRYKAYLHQISADPAPIPPPDLKAADEAHKAAGKLEKDSKQAATRANKAKDPDDKAMKQVAADDVKKTAAMAAASADRTQAKVDAVQAAVDAGAPIPKAAPNALPIGSPIHPPKTPTLPELDLDTGKPSAGGEYFLADRTYAHLLANLVDPNHKSASPAEAAVDADIQRFFVHGVPPSPVPVPPKIARKQAALNTQVQADLIKLKQQDKHEHHK